jgi:hypothetical protein
MGYELRFYHQQQWDMYQEWWFTSPQNGGLINYV